MQTLRAPGIMTYRAPLSFLLATPTASKIRALVTGEIFA
jgi:hypothetical protein